MSLPKINQPIFELKLPSNGKKIKYRPFTVKEEKILLIAQESDDIDQTILSIEQVISNCIIDYDVKDLAIFDIEYLLMNIRAKAVNNEVKFTVYDAKEKEDIEISLDINEIKIEVANKKDTVIEIADNTYLKMKYPSIRIAKHLISNNEKESDEDKSNKLYDILKECIASLTMDGQVYKLVDFTDTEINDFIDSLPGDALQKVKEFFENMPSMKIEKKYTNSKGEEKTFVAKGTETFFL